MMSKYWLLITSLTTLVVLIAAGCSSESTPLPISLPGAATATLVPTKVASPILPAISGPTPTEATLTPSTPSAGRGSPPPMSSPLLLPLPVLMGTPVPIPQEPITPTNVNRIQQLAMWGRGHVKQVAYSPDGQFLAIGTTIGVWLHDAKTLELHHFMLTDEEVMAMAFLSDGQLIAQVGDKTIDRWDVTTGSLMGSWQIGVDFLERVAFAPDGTRLAAPLRGEDKVGIWEVSSSKLLYTLESQPGYERLVNALAFSPDGTMLASATVLNQDQPQLSAGLHNAIEVWNVKTGALIHTLSLPDTGETSSLTFSPDSNLLALAHDKDIRMWAVETGILLHTLQGHAATVVSGSLFFSPDGQQLTSAGFDQTIRLWNVAEGKLLQTLTAPGLWVFYLVPSPDGSTFIGVGDKDFRDFNTLRLWNTSTGAVLGEVKGYADGISDLAVASDGTLYTAHPHNLGVRRWDIKTGQITRHFPGFTTDGSKLAISANGQILAASQYDPYPSVLIWDTATGQLVQTLEDYDQVVESLALSPDGALAASSEGKAAYIYNIQTGQQLYGLSVDRERISVSYLIFSPDGLKLASHEQKLHLFEVKTGNLLFTLDQEWSLAFTPDGIMIATGDTQGKITLWKADTGEMLRPLANQKSLVKGLAFSPDGQLLASVQTDHAIYLWDVGTGRLLWVFEGLPFIEDITFLPDGKILLSRSPRDGTLRFWGVPSQ